MIKLEDTLFALTKMSPVLKAVLGSSAPEVLSANLKFQYTFYLLNNTNIRINGGLIYMSCFGW